MRLLLSLIVTLLSISSVSALTTPVQSHTTGPATIPTEIDVSLTFDRFDDTLGVLDSITLTVTTLAQFDIILTNNGATDQLATGTATTSINVISSLFLSPPAIPMSGATGQVTLPGHENTPQTPAIPVPFLNIPGNNQKTYTVTYTGAQADFVGTGQTVPIRFTSLSGLSTAGGGGQLSSSQATRVIVTAELFYEYHKPRDSTVNGDPQFAGFQGQNFQFHGLPDTVFNLVSSPELQINALFVYLSSGSCQYNETACFTHPGTYLGEVGVAIGAQNFTIVSGPHSKGLHLFVQTAGQRYPIPVGSHFSFDTVHGKMSIAIPSTHNVEIRSPNFAFNLINSDSFLNMEASLLNTPLLRMGAQKHHIKHCDDNTAIEQSLIKHYPVQNWIHGLVGQTWRSVTFCDVPYQGGVGDYIATDLFSNDYRYNFFTATQ